MTRKRRSYLDDDGDKLPSVTEILSGLGWKSHILIAWANKVGREQGMTTHAASKPAMLAGTRGHDLIESYLLGRDPPKPTKTMVETPTVLDNAEQAFAAFRDLWDGGLSSRVEVLGTETMMVDKVSGYGGTADLVCLLDGVPCILDYKTGSAIYQETAVQLAAYCCLWLVDGADHVLDADGAEMSLELVAKRKACRSIHRVGIIHAPVDGRDATLVMVPPDVHASAARIWHCLIAMHEERATLERFGAMLKEAIPEKVAEEAGPKLPF